MTIFVLCRDARGVTHHLVTLHCILQSFLVPCSTSACVSATVQATRIISESQQDGLVMRVRLCVFVAMHLPEFCQVRGSFFQDGKSKESGRKKVRRVDEQEVNLHLIVLEQMVM